VLRVEHADHAGTNPDAEQLVITPITCSIVGQRGKVCLEAGTRAAAIYAATDVEEPYYCQYGLNAEFELGLEAAGLRISGRDPDGGARVVELDGHPFFVATLYVFQARETHADLHPLTRAFLAAASERVVAASLSVAGCLGAVTAAFHRAPATTAGP
jgi:CTP synthase (UTP-ammonia lyase)